MEHLTAAPAPAEEQRPKRSFAELVQAIYEDKRVGHEARELLLAVSYAADLAKREEDVSPLRIARRVLGRDQIGRPRYATLVAADAPRYKEPREAGDWHPAAAPSCEAPRLRQYRPRPAKPYQPDPQAPVPIRPHQLPPELAALKAEATATYTPPRDWRTEDGVCGANSHHRVLEKDPRTGWVIPHWFCKRHKDHAARVTEQVKQQNEQAPQPIPNTGGLLPCYFKADWEKVYRHYLPRWEPPVYGLCADDWPTPDKDPVPQRGRLRLVIGKADLERDPA